MKYTITFEDSKDGGIRIYGGNPRKSTLAERQDSGAFQKFKEVLVFIAEANKDDLASAVINGKEHIKKLRK